MVVLSRLMAVMAELVEGALLALYWVMLSQLRAAVGVAEAVGV